MSTALAIIKPTTVEEARTLAVLLAESAMLQPSLRNRPADVFAIVLSGMELGLGPMQSLRSISIIQGRPSMNADLLAGLAKNNPKCKYFRLVESTEERATYETHREGSPEPERLTFTLADAKALGLAEKDNWKKQPKAMLRARASAALARAVYQDSVLGLYSREELGQTTVDAEDAEFEAVTTEEAAPIAPLAGLDMNKFDGLVECMPEGWKREANPHDYHTPARKVEFPVADETNDERERMLKAEQAERQQNWDDLHKMVNAIYPGDKNKQLRVDKYKMWGLKQTNPAKQFLKMSIEDQRLIMKEVERWYAMASSDIPWSPNKAEVEAIKEEERKDNGGE